LHRQWFVGEVRLHKERRQFVEGEHDGRLDLGPCRVRGGLGQIQPNLDIRYVFVQGVELGDTAVKFERSLM